MTQEDKDLLLKDLCARLSYGVVVGTIDNDGSLSNFWTLDLYNRLTEDVIITHCELNADELTYFGDIRPYLFPLERMTEEQCHEFYCRFVENEIDYDDFKEYYFDNGLWHKVLTSIDDCSEVIDWFNKNYFDYRGLIPMGLANDATGLNIY